MTLHEHFRASPMTLEEYVTWLGVRRGRALGWLYQGRTPEVEDLLRIRELTDGSVDLEDWCRARAERKRRAS